MAGASNQHRRSTGAIGLAPAEARRLTSLTSGVHHVALGVRDLPAMRAFYRDLVGFTQEVMAFEDVAPEVMREVARSPELVFSGAVVGLSAGGILLEFIHMTRPAPRALRERSRYGDVGVTKTTLAVADVQALYEGAGGRLDFCGSPRTAAIPGRGDQAFVHAWDPEGNLVEFVSAGTGPGGVRSIGLGVTDLDRSLSFYRDVLDLDVVGGGAHAAFSGLVDEAAGAAGVKVRSCLLAGSSQDGAVELIEVSNPRGRSIPFAARWGDFGYLQVCFSCGDIHAVVARLEGAGATLLCSPKPVGAGSIEESGAFVYARDPDGVPIEFLFLPG